MGERIAQLRQSKGLSQAKLAKALGLSTSAIAMYEQGRREPSVSILVALADTLGVTLDYLITGQPASGQKNHTSNFKLATTILYAAWRIGGAGTDKNNSP